MANQLVLSPPSLERLGTRWETRARLWSEATPGGTRALVGSVAFLVEGPSTIHTGVDVFFPIALTVAMRLGWPLRVEGHLPVGWKESMQRFQEIHSVWFPRASMVPVEAEWSPPHDGPMPGGKAVFFSAGVDSFHAVLSESPTHLIHVDGFDFPLHETRQRSEAWRDIDDAARALGLPLWRVTTDARLLLDTHAPHGEVGTAVLAGAARLFTGNLGAVVMGSSDNWESTAQRSDHFLLTECFSAGDLRFEIEGRAKDRVGKLKAIAGNPVVRRFLRVCWTPPAGTINCGRCEKCLRTMVALRAIGVEEPFPAFAGAWPDDPIELPEVRPIARTFWEEIGLELERRAAESPLAAELNDAREKWAADRWAEELWQLGKSAATEPAWPALSRRILKPVLATAATTDPAWLARKAARAARNEPPA